MRIPPSLLFIALAVLIQSANAGEWSANDLAAARAIYVAKCAKCHRFYEPTKYAEPDWRAWMIKMNKKSKLKPPQSELLNRYLDTYRAGRLAGKPETAP